MAEHSGGQIELKEAGIERTSSQNENLGFPTTVTKTNMGLENPGSHYDHFGNTLPSSLLFRWGLFEPRRDDPLVSGQADFVTISKWVIGMQKLERQKQERLAAVYMEPAVKRLIEVLDRKTSIKWEDLLAEVGGEVPELLKSLGLSAGANLCEATHNRLRLSEYGVNLLERSSLDDQTFVKSER